MLASADNDGPACSTVADAPALYAEAFAVGAVDRSGSLAAFSSRGPVTADGSGRVKPDVVAPGVGVVSAFPGNNDDPVASEGGVCGLGGHEIVPNDYTGCGLVNPLKAIRLALGQP